MNRLGYIVTALAIGMATSASTVCADAVLTTDGSRFVGTIQQLVDGKLVMISDVAGKIEIDAAKIVAVESQEPITVQFASGDRLIGKMTVDTNQASSILHAAVGNIAVAASEIQSIWRAGAESPEIVALKAAMEETKAALTPKWTAKIEGGGTFTDGNTDTLNGRGRFDMIRKSDRDMLNFYLAADYSEQDDKRTTNEYRGGVTYEHSMTNRWYWYTRLELEFDEFEDLDLRAVSAAGAGYYWLRKPAHELKSRFGVGYRHESYDTGRIEDGAVIDLGLDYRVDVTPWVEFTHSTTYSPDIQETDDYRLDLQTAIVFPFKNDRWKLKVGMHNEYNSQPQSGFDRLDNTYFANLVLEITE